jgi:hypothetical protein
MLTGSLKQAAALALAAVALSVTTTARAGIVTTTATILSPPPAAVNPKDPPQSNDATYIFLERITTLTSTLDVDAHGAGTFDNDKTGKHMTSTSLNRGTIAAGTAVESYMLFSNPAKGAHPYSGSVTFSTAILGVEVLTKSLNNTDGILGSTTTKYYTGTDRGLELGSPTDSFTLNLTANTLTFDFKTSSVIDEIRIITAVPEPATMAMCGTSLVVVTAVALRRRKAEADRA